MCENTHRRVVIILLCLYTISVTILMTKYNTHKMYNPRITEPEMGKKI